MAPLGETQRYMPSPSNKKPPRWVALKESWRTEGDSNPRYACDVYTLSRRAPSTTRPPVRALRPVPLPQAKLNILADPELACVGLDRGRPRPRPRVKPGVTTSRWPCGPVSAGMTFFGPMTNRKRQEPRKLPCAALVPGGVPRPSSWEERGRVLLRNLPRRVALAIMVAACGPPVDVAHDALRRAVSSTAWQRLWRAASRCTLGKYPSLVPGVVHIVHRSDA